MAISVNFQMFSNAGVTSFEDKPVICQFTKCHEPDEWNGEKAIEVKSLFKRELDPKIHFYGAHRPFLKSNVKNHPHWTDGSGRQVARRYAFAETQSSKTEIPCKWCPGFGNAESLFVALIGKLLGQN